MVAMSEDRAIEDAYRFLREHTTGELRFDELFQPLRYVLGPDGRPVAPASHPMLASGDTVLFVPENAEGAMELQVALSRLDPDGGDGAVTDRWRIYHGDPDEGQWASMEIEGVRFGKWVVDGEGLMRPNPLAADEARLCRRINEEHRDELGNVCRRIADADVESPLLVGVDPLGFDVRRRFDVIRVPAPNPMLTPDEVEHTLIQLMANG